MSTVSAPARPRPASAPPAPAAAVRHGKCSLHLSIGGTRYRLHPITPPAGFKAVWSLRKQSPDELGRLPGRRREGPAARLHVPGFRDQRRRLQAHRVAEGPRPHPRPEGPPGGRPPQPCPPPRRRGARPAPAGPARRPVRHRVPVRHRPGSRRPPRRAGRGGELSSCAACGEAFDPVVSRDPHFCGPCAEEGAYK